MPKADRCKLQQLGGQSHGNGARSDRASRGHRIFLAYGAKDVKFKTDSGKSCNNSAVILRSTLRSTLQN